MSKGTKGQKIDFVMAVDFQNCFMEGGNLAVKGADQEFRQEFTDSMRELSKTAANPGSALRGRKSYCK